MPKRKRICRKIHYKSKLKYELIADGGIIDLFFHRQVCRKYNTLERHIVFNTGRIHVNPLGFVTRYMPF